MNGEERYIINTTWMRLQDFDRRDDMSRRDLLELSAYLEDCLRIVKKHLAEPQPARVPVHVTINDSIINRSSGLFGTNQD